MSAVNWKTEHGESKKCCTFWVGRTLRLPAEKFIPFPFAGSCLFEKFPIFGNNDRHEHTCTGKGEGDVASSVMLPAGQQKSVSATILGADAAAGSDLQVLATKSRRRQCQRRLREGKDRRVETGGVR